MPRLCDNYSDSRCLQASCCREIDYGRTFTPTHLIIVAVVAIVLFGGKKLPELGKGLGEGLRGFKEGMKGVTDDVKTGDSAHTRDPKSRRRQVAVRWADQSRARSPAHLVGPSPIPEIQQESHRPFCGDAICCF